MLYAIGLLFFSYGAPAWEPVVPLSGHRLLFAMLPFGIGVRFADRLPTISARAAVALVAAGTTLYIAENYTLALWLGFPPERQNFLLGSIPLGAGAMLLALRPGEPGWVRTLAPLGRFTLVVYLAHLFFVDLFRPVRHALPHDVWRFLMPLAVLGASLAFAMAVARTPLRRLVR